MSTLHAVAQKHIYGKAVESRSQKNTPPRNDTTAAIQPLFPEQNSLIRRKENTCACGGGCPHCQAKTDRLTVSQPHDRAEIEADQIADKVMHMPGPGNLHPKTNGFGAAGLQNHPDTDSINRKCNACEEEEDVSGTIQRKEGFTTVAPTPPPGDTTPSIRNVIRSGGHKLDHTTRRFFEPRFGFDLSHVRVHADSAAGQSARAINARAYTLGSAIVFANGEYRPEDDGGRRLLAHELTHVIQQGTGQIHELQRQRADESVTRGEELCSEEHGAEAREALNNAYHWIRRTIHRINSDHEGTEADLRYYFGDSYDRGAIMLRLGELQEFIREGVVLRCADPSSDPECGADVLAYCSSHHSLISRVVNDRTITVCQPNFHRLTVPMRVATMVHEASHNYLGTNDHFTYGDIDCRATTTARLTDRDLSENADSYGCLVYGLGRRIP